MDVVERLTLDAAQADTMLAAEHRHRYEFAAELCHGLRVLDLCCGSGYGAAILARAAREVVGVDVDLATVETARATVGGVVSNVVFEGADALGYLRAGALEEFDAVVCFEGLEHLRELEAVVEILRGHAARGLRIVASVPNDKLFEDTNPYHVTQFGYDEARRLFAGCEQVTLVPQFLAEGSLILPSQAHETDVRVTLGDRHESEYANHFIFCVGFPAGEVERAHHGRVQLNVSPVFNRWSEDLKRGASALRRENARLARARLGKADAAAGALLSRLQASDAQIAALEERWRLAVRADVVLQKGGASEAGVARGHLSENGGPTAKSGALPSWGRASVVDAAPLSLQPGADPNSWEQRRRRAAEVLIPWIEQTVPLDGRMVLEFGCGNGAVSSAFAGRADRVIGLDIDPAAVADGRRELAARNLANAELQHRSREGILEAVGEFAGRVDVFLLYAVLEHLTVQERLAVLHLAREVVTRNGAIVVCETPNRLTLLDHHTAQMPFFHLLPDELAARYYERSTRTDFTSAMAAAAPQGESALLEAVARWGRGVSFHEFELVFGDLGRHVIASSYDPLLLGERPVHPEEVTLARYLDRTMPGLAPAFSRQWLDLILSPVPTEHRAAWMRPWTADTTQSTGVGWTAWDNLHLPGPDSALTVELPHPTQRLLVGTVLEDAESLALRVHTTGEPLPVTIELQVPPPATAFAVFDFTRPVGRFVISASSRCHIVFVGYEE